MYIDRSTLMVYRIPLINIYLWYKWIIKTLTIAPKFQTKIHLIAWRLGSPSKLFVEKSQKSGGKTKGMDSKNGLNINSLKLTHLTHSNLNHWDQEMTFPFGANDPASWQVRTVSLVEQETVSLLCLFRGVFLLWACWCFGHGTMWFWMPWEKTFNFLSPNAAFFKHLDSPAVYEEVVLNIFQWKWLEGSILPEANIAPEKWWLGTPLILGRPIFRWYVSFREGNHSNP